MAEAYDLAIIGGGWHRNQRFQILLAEIPKNRPDVAYYGRALEFVDFNSDFMDFNIPHEAIVRQIHWLLMSGVHDTHIQPGNYRTVPNWIEHQGIKVSESPFHVDVPILMREFSLWLGEHQGIHPVLQAGVAHGHLIAIHPFVGGNGRVTTATLSFRCIYILLFYRHWACSTQPSRLLCFPSC